MPDKSAVADQRKSVVCDNCHTTLPDNAVACWKCGRQFPSAHLSAPLKPSGPNIAIAVVTFPIALAFFACLGWSIPFTLWGLTVSLGGQNSDGSGLLGAVGTILFAISSIALIGGAWWGAYWIVNRVNNSTGERGSRGA